MVKRGTFSRTHTCTGHTVSQAVQCPQQFGLFACHFPLPCPFWGFVKNKLKRTDATEAFGDEEHKWPHSAPRRRTDGLLHSISSSRSLSPRHARIAELVLCSEGGQSVDATYWGSFLFFLFFLVKALTERSVILDQSGLNDVQQMFEWKTNDYQTFKCYVFLMGCKLLTVPDLVERNKPAAFIL